MPKVSVIIPTHNRARCLRQAISSVLNQSFQDFELIVVDDASTDDTAAVVGTFSDYRLQYLCHEIGKGGSGARNTGIARANGEYVAFLDDDDEWMPEKLQKQMELFCRGGVKIGVVYTGYDIIERNTGLINGQMRPSRRGDLQRALMINNCLGGTSSVVVRKEYFALSGVFDETLPSFQDYDLWIRLSRVCHFDFVSESLLKYYVHQQKISNNFEALENGIHIMLGKYGGSATFRRCMSYRCLNLGVRQIQDGWLAKGRKLLQEAMRLYPFEIRNYFHWGLSFLGEKNYHTIIRAKTGWLGR